MSEVSVAEAKAHLTSLLHQVESGTPVHITRRGQPVAVLLSENEYTQLQRRAQSKNFWEQIEEMRADSDFEAVDWSCEEREDGARVSNRTIGDRPPFNAILNLSLKAGAILK